MLSIIIPIVHSRSKSFYGPVSDQNKGIALIMIGLIATYVVVLSWLAFEEHIPMWAYAVGLIAPLFVGGLILYFY